MPFSYVTLLLPRFFVLFLLRNLDFYCGLRYNLLRKIVCMIELNNYLPHNADYVEGNVY